MTSDEIIKLGSLLGLPFNRNDNYDDMINKNIVVFNGCNGQRFLIDGKLTNEEIYKTFGESLKLFGKRLKCMEIDRILSTNSDFTTINDIY